MLPATKVLANTHDHGISPFGSEQNGHKLHCKLNKHYLFHTYCPHSVAKQDKEKSLIVPDCSRKTSGTLPSVGSSNTHVLFFEIVHFNRELDSIGKQFTYALYGSGFLLSDSIDHPPQTV